MSFVDFHKKIASSMNTKLDALKVDKFIFGAHIFTQFLFNFGLREDHFKSVLDNDPDKISHRLYGSKLHVRSPQCLRSLDSPVIVLRAAQYTGEIKEDIHKNINDSVQFISG